MTYRNPQTGQTQQVGENETVRRGILERLGWRVAGDKAPAAEKPAEAARRADAEQDDAGQPACIEQGAVEPLHVHLAIDDEGQHAGIEHGDRR